MANAKNTLVLACVAVFAAMAACAADNASSWSWTCEPGASIAGNSLTVSLGSSGTAYASATIDLTPYLGQNSGARLTIRARGENVVANGAYGARATVRFTEAALGSTVYYETPLPTGTFGWTNVTLHVSWLARATPSNGLATVAFGIQDGTGTAVFDLSSCILDAEPLGIASPPAGFSVQYPAFLPDAPLHGFDSPTRAMTKADVETLASWGARLVRFQICRDFGSVGGNDDIDEYTRWVDSRLDNLVDVLGWAEDHGMRVCVDLHVIPGGYSGTTSPEELAALRDEAFASQYVDTWRRIARRVARHPALYGYDLVNEPKQRGPAVCSFLELQRRAAVAIRAIDPVTPVVVEACRAASPQAYEFMPPLALDNVIYEIHHYAPDDYTFQGVGSRPRLPSAAWPDASRGWDEAGLRRYLRHVRAFQLQYGARILVGEFSAVAWAPGAENYLRNLTGIFEEYGWDWTYFAFRDWPPWDIDRVGVEPEYLSFDTSNPRMAVLLGAIRQTQWSPPIPGPGQTNEIAAALADWFSATVEDDASVAAGGVWGVTPPVENGAFAVPAGASAIRFLTDEAGDGAARVCADITPAGGWPRSSLLALRDQAERDGIRAAVVLVEDGDDGSLAPFGFVRDASGLTSWRRLVGFAPLPFEQCRLVAELDYSGETPRVSYLAGFSTPDRLRDSNGQAWFDAPGDANAPNGDVSVGGAASVAALRGQMAYRPEDKTRTIFFVR